MCDREGLCAEGMNAADFSDADGFADWRTPSSKFLAMARSAPVCVVILSKEFLLSSACEVFYSVSLGCCHTSVGCLQSAELFG